MINCCSWCVIIIMLFIILIPGGDTIKAEEKFIIEMDDNFWENKLTEQQFSVLVKKGTEPAFNNKYYTNKKEGLYVCAACNNRLFSSYDKYESGTGWPSFNDVITKRAVGTRKDNKLFMDRTEVFCQRCGGHLGHVFNDGPEPTGLRYCINSAALKFLEKAYFAMGCFWKPEALFGSLSGVYFTSVGYAGGEMSNPTYHNLGNHTETIEIIYDPEKISYEDLLTVYWQNHIPTQKSISTQYESIIFFNNPEQKEIAQMFLQDKKDDLNSIIYTDIKRLEIFNTAEQYHQKYILKRNEKIYNEVKDLFADKDEFDNSKVAARLNAYSADFLTYSELKDEISNSYLNVKYEEKINMITGEVLP